MNWIDSRGGGKTLRKKKKGPTPLAQDLQREEKPPFAKKKKDPTIEERNANTSSKDQVLFRNPRRKRRNHVTAAKEESHPFVGERGVEGAFGRGGEEGSEKADAGSVPTVLSQRNTRSWEARNVEGKEAFATKKEGQRSRKPL